MNLRADSQSRPRRRRRLLQQISSFLFCASTLVAVGCGAPTGGSGGGTAPEASSLLPGAHTSVNNAAAPSGERAETAVEGDEATHSAEVPSVSTLRLELPAGTQLGRRLRVVDRATRDYDDYKQQEESERELDFLLDALEWNSDDQLRMRVTFQRFRLRMGGAEARLDFDSDRDRDPPPILQGLAAIVGESFIVLLDRQAKLQGVEGVAEMADAAAAKLPASAMRDRLAQALRAEFNATALKALFTPLLPVYPTETPREGLSWHEHTHPKLHDNVELHQETTWEVRQWSEHNGLFRYRGEARTDADTLVRGLLARGYYDLSGRAEGSVRIDPQTGWLESSDHQLTLQGEWRVVSTNKTRASGGAAALPGQSVPEARTRSIRVERLR